MWQFMSPATAQDHWEFSALRPVQPAFSVEDGAAAIRRLRAPLRSVARDSLCGTQTRDGVSSLTSQVAFVLAVNIRRPHGRQQHSRRSSGESPAATEPSSGRRTLRRRAERDRDSVGAPRRGGTIGRPSRWAQARVGCAGHSSIRAVPTCAGLASLWVTGFCSVPPACGFATAGENASGPNFGPVSIMSMPKPYFSGCRRWLVSCLVHMPAFTEVQCRGRCGETSPRR
jgi:hypothetical protein